MTRRRTAVARLPPHKCAAPGCEWVGFEPKPGYYLTKWLATHAGSNTKEDECPAAEPGEGDDV